MKFCSNCGAQLPEGARFCENCGTAVAAPAAAATAPPGPVPPASPATGPVQYPTAPAPGYPQQVPSSDGAPPAWSAEPAAVTPGPRKSRRGLLTGIGGIAAVGVLGVVGYFVYDHFNGPNGGADSPRAAVIQLSAAADGEDAVTALSLLPPGEVGPIVDLYKDVQNKATSTGVAAKDNPFAGFDLHVKGVAVKSEQLGPDVAAVTITGGTVSWTVNPDKLQGPLRIDGRGHVRHASKGSADLVKVTRNASHGAPLRLMTVQRDGKWYVSPMYTLLEAWRTNKGLPEPDFSKSIDYSGTGAASSTKAVEQAAKSLASYDVDGFLDLLSPDEAAALYQYRDAIITSLHQDGALAQLQSENRLTVDSVKATAGDAVDGRVPVTVRSASGSLSNENGDHYNWTLDRNCVSYVRNGHSHGGCLDKALGQQGIGAKLAGQFPSLTLLTQEVDGRWYLSPMATIVTDLRSAVAKLDTDDVAAMLRVPQFGSVDGQLTAGKAVQGSVKQLPDYPLYEASVPAGKVFSACVESTDGGSGGFGSRLYGPDGRALDGSAVLAKDGGRYRIVVFGHGGTSFKVTAALSDVRPVTVPSTVPASGDSECGERLLSVDATPGQPLLLTTGDGAPVAITSPSGELTWTSVLEPAEAGKYLVAVPANEAVTIGPLPADVLKAGSRTAANVQSDHPTTLRVFVGANQQLQVHVTGVGMIEPYVEVLSPDGTQLSSDSSSYFSSSAATVSPPVESTGQLYELRIEDNYNASGSVLVSVTGQ